MSNTYNLFAVRLFHGKIIVPVDIHKKILKYIEENYKEQNTISCVDGFQYHGNFNGKKELNKIIDNYVSSVYHLKLMFGWLNVLKNKSYNKPHNHIGKDVKMAGVLYLSNNNNNINFARDNDVFEIKPKLFDYLIFPYDLLHYVLPEERKETRVCYAFNLKD